MFRAQCRTFDACTSSGSQPRSPRRSPPRRRPEYAQMPIHDDEKHLLATADDLESYFNAHGLLLKDDRVLALVRRIGHSLRPQPTDDYVVYEFYVLRDPSPNAFALPNGSIYVHTGMLARLHDED